MKRTALRSLCVILLLLMSATAFTAEQYIDDVLNNRITVCKYVRLAVERHVNDLKRVGSPDFPYHFDRSLAERKIKFTQELRHTKGEWARLRQKITLSPWQQFVDWCVFGWVRPDGNRRFSKVYIEVARKNGKTTMAAAAANYTFLMDGEAGAEVYCVATKKDQAKIAWNEAERQLQKHPFLKTKVRTYKQNSTVVIPGTASLMRPLGQDSDTEDGLNPHFVLVDEYHAHPDNSMINVMESGMGARKQPLTYIITTAGFDMSRACYQEERQLVVDTLEGNLSPTPENIFGIIFTLDEGDDWTNEHVWIKANPNIGINPDWDHLRKRVAEALISPAKQNDVKTKNFNIWTQAVTRWIGAEAWKACDGKVFEEKLKGRRCFGGLDLSSTTDISAWVLCFPPEADGERWQFLYRFYMPKENILERARQDKVPYVQWAQKGLVVATPGNVIDYDFIEVQIKKDIEDFRIQQVAFDPWNATEIINHLQETGIDMVAFRQGYASMTAPSKDFEKRTLSKEINHGGNPVMTWMVSCTEVRTDPAGNIKPVKPDRQKTGKRIDGVVASIMALGIATQQNGNGRSIYEDRGMEILYG